MFVFLRLTNAYGNPAQPSIEGAMGRFDLPEDAIWQCALIALLNVEKYPPSSQSLLMTLGIGALILAWYQRFDLGVQLDPCIACYTFSGWCRSRSILRICS